MFADLVYEDMVCKNALSGSTIGNEVDHILRLWQSATIILEVVGDVVFCVEVGCDCCCTGCSSD